MLFAIVLSIIILAGIAVLLRIALTHKPYTTDELAVHTFTATDKKTGKVSHHHVLIRESQRAKILKSKLK